MSFVRFGSITMVSFFKRRWWRPWNWSTRTWGIAIILGIVISPFATRSAYLWWTPDVAIPVDVENVIQAEISQSQDALYRYASALQQYDQSRSELTSAANSFEEFNAADSAMRTAVLPSNATWDGRLDQWLIDQKSVIDEFVNATAMLKSSGPSLRTADYSFTGVDTHQRLRMFVVLTSAEALRRERAGEYDFAWTLHRANLRCARHCMMPRFVICHLIGIGIRNYTYIGIARWAGNSAVTFEQLKEARDELAIDQTERVSTSELIKSNYLCFRNLMSRPAAAHHLIPNVKWMAIHGELFIYVKRMLLWTLGEPEVLLRLARQELINSSDQIDLPVATRRTARHSKNEVVFDLDSLAQRKSGQMSPNRITSSLESHFAAMPGLGGYILGAGSLDKINRHDCLRRQILDVALASQQYRRMYGEFPASLEKLVPEFIKEQSLDPTETLLRYNRLENGNAMVWNAGDNSTNDPAEVEEDKGRDFIYRINLHAGDASCPIESANPVATQ